MCWEDFLPLIFNILGLWIDDASLRWRMKWFGEQDGERCGLRCVWAAEFLENEEISHLWPTQAIYFKFQVIPRAFSPPNMDNSTFNMQEQLRHKLSPKYYGLVTARGKNAEKSLFFSKKKSFSGGSFS